MQKKVVEIIVENNAESMGSKSKAVKISKAQTEVENFGIVEINNSSAKARVKNLKDKGYEKNVTSATKKPVKKSLNKVDDYFSFDFKSGKKSDIKSNIESYEAVSKRTAKAGAKNKTAEEKINAVIEAMGLKSACLEAKEEEVITKLVEGETKTFKLETEDERQVFAAAHACERFIFDKEAERVVTIARTGYLFD